MQHAHRFRPGHDETKGLHNASAAGIAQTPGLTRLAFAFLAAMLVGCGGGDDDLSAQDGRQTTQPVQCARPDSCR